MSVLKLVGVLLDYPREELWQHGEELLAACDDPALNAARRQQRDGQQRQKNRFAPVVLHRVSTSPQASQLRPWSKLAKAKEEICLCSALHLVRMTFENCSDHSFIDSFSDCVGPVWSQISLGSQAWSIPRQHQRPRRHILV